VTEINRRLRVALPFQKPHSRRGSNWLILLGEKMPSYSFGKQVI